MSRYDQDQQRAALVASTDTIRYEQPVLADVPPLTFEVPDGRFVPRVDPEHPFYHHQHEPFNIARYRFCAPPIEIGASRLDYTVLPAVLTNVLRLPIKFPGTEYRLPVEIAPFADLIERVARYESGFNARHRECFVHVTIDDSEVLPGEYHRYPGFHGDGVQGAKFSQREYTPIEHSYVFVSEPPTEFCLQPFFVEHLNDARHNLFHEFERQIREANIVGTLPWHVYLIDPYMIHRTPPILVGCRRIFFRITFCYTELQHPKNTQNPHFPESGVYAARWDVRNFLTTYPGQIPWEMYGLSSGPVIDSPPEPR